MSWRKLLFCLLPLGTTGVQAAAPAPWEPAAFRALVDRPELVDGLLLGGLAFMAVAGMLFVFMFRERAFAFNALATVTYFLGEANAKGYASLYLWPDAPDWSVRCLPLFALLGVGLNILFVRDLLATRSRFPRADRLLLGLLALQWLPGIGVLFGDIRVWAEIAFAFNFPITAVLLLLGVHALAKGIHAARYYTAAYAVLATGSLFHALSMAGKLGDGWSAEYALPLAMLLSNALLMASMVDRVMQAQKDKAVAQEALLAAHATHEAHLAEQVRIRTAELQTANARLQESLEEIHQLAFFDPLTNLLNRRLLQDRLALASAASRRSGRYSAFLMLDLDNFKTLNDTHGHAVGDLLLVEVANRLRDCVRATDTIARLGGDEFVVIVGELSAEAAESRRLAETVAGKIIARLADGYRLTIRPPGKGERIIEHHCSASVGIALFGGDADGGEVMAQADAAMYRAKAAGRHCVRLHEPAGLPAPEAALPR